MKTKIIRYCAQKDINLPKENYDSGYPGLATVLPVLRIRKGEELSVSYDYARHAHYVFSPSGKRFMTRLFFTKLILNKKIQSMKSLVAREALR